MSRRHSSVWLHHFIIFVIICILSFLSTLPAFTNNTFKLSYDGNIHLARYDAITQALSHVSLPPLVNFIGLNHTGLAMNGMYPWITSIIFIIPKLLFNNPIVALMVGFIILNFLTIFNVFLLAKFITHKRWIQILGVTIYQFSSYHMAVLYSRNALGEALAYAFLPLVLLGCLKIWHNSSKGWLYLGFGMGAIANSHILSLIIVTTMIVIFCFTRIFRHQLTQKEVTDYTKATILAILSSFYTLTNIASLLFTNLLMSPTPKLVPLNATKYWQALLDNSIIERSVSFNMGPINTFFLFFLMVMLFTNKSGLWRHWTIATIIVFFSTFDWLPWQNLTGTPINMIQFLGRLLFISSLLLAISVMYYFDQYPLKHKDINFVVTIALIAISLNAVHTYHNIATKDGYRFWLTKTNYDQTIKNSAIGIDYLPANNKHQLQSRITALQNTSIPSLKIQSQSYNSADYIVTTAKEGYYSLPIAVYSGIHYNVTLNHKKVKLADSHALKLKIPKGSNHLKITATVNDSNYFTMLISLLTISYSIWQLTFANTRRLAKTNKKHQNDK
ncbi:hypothetical protein FGL74_08530 [Leuconostoc koreense]|nr:hypothetical protein FGL74_08530 [Leuconostoc mesenteroides]QGM25642.1 hypothetical protein GJV51_06490 [Leuconostoc mesenteroides subsp. mesenteroides]